MKRLGRDVSEDECSCHDNGQFWPMIEQILTAAAHMTIQNTSSEFGKGVMAC
ncbi:hypothetical protein PQBR44_0167 (plasmid) [Pseudomonas putida UWC1]|nr:hypothetical protein PQBR44_0167 [Pseudomonas putida UWC1]